MHLATISEMHAQLLAMLYNTKANMPPQPPTPPPPKRMVCLLRGSFKGKPLVSHAQGAYFKGKKKQPWVCNLCVPSPPSHTEMVSHLQPLQPFYRWQKMSKRLKCPYMLFLYKMYKLHVSQIFQFNLTPS